MLATFRDNAKNHIRDGSGLLTDPDVEALVREAVKRYSRARPQILISEFAGDGGYDYDLPAEWDDDFSDIEQVEYPADRRIPSYVDIEDRILINTAAGWKLRFLHDTPLATQLVRLSFTALHEVELASTTVPEAHYEAVQYIAASLGCEQLASHYSNLGDSTIAADSVNHTSRAQDYARRARRFMELAGEIVPLEKDGKARAAGKEISWGDRMDHLTHPSR